MSRSRELPNLIAQMSFVTFTAAMLSAAPEFLAIPGLLGLAAAVGLQAAARSRDSAMLTELRRLSKAAPSACRRRSPGSP